MSEANPDDTTAVAVAGDDAVRRVTMDDGREVILVSYEITDEPMEEEDAEPTPPTFAADVEGLYDHLRDAPASTVGRLEVLVQRYPKIPSLKNWLSVAYIAAGRVAEADAVADVLVRDHPGYLFGRLAVADRHLRAGDLDRVPEPLGGHLDLKLIYPHRTRFHVSEAVGLWRLVGELCLRRGDLDRAGLYLQMMREHAPDHAMTELLADRMAMEELLQRMAGLMAMGGRRRKAAVKVVGGKATKKKAVRRKGRG